MVKTSPAARARVSPWRSVLSSASATERSRSSPWLRPSRSLTPVNLSRPSWTTASLWLVAPGVNDRHRQPVGEAPRAREARERVLVRERADLLLEARTRGPFAGERRLEARGSPRAGHAPRPRAGARALLPGRDVAAGGIGRAASPAAVARRSCGGWGSRLAKRVPAPGQGPRARRATASPPVTARNASSRAWAGASDAIRRRHPRSRRARDPARGFAQAGPLRVEQRARGARRPRPCPGARAPGG